MESNYDATSYEGVFPCSVSITDITEVETAQFDSRSITSTVWNDSSSDSLPVQKPEISIPAASSSFGMEQSTAPVEIDSVDTCIGMSQEYLHETCAIEWKVSILLNSLPTSGRINCRCRRSN